MARSSSTKEPHACPCILLETLVEEHLRCHADADKCIPTLSVNTLNSLREAIKAVGDPELHQTFARSVHAMQCATMPDPGDARGTGRSPRSLAHGEDATAAAGMRFVVVIRPHARPGGMHPPRLGRRRRSMRTPMIRPSGRDRLASTAFGPPWSLASSLAGQAPLLRCEH